ncbi:MAG TPA: CoA transferase [Acidimicrobiales bacterium]|nr:CoA transferase [Acidimicrobiales bacterium]
MPHQPMRGVRVLEVAQFTFTPAAGAVLADWGAEVIKVEHAVTGDAQRGLRIGAGGAAMGSFQPLMEHPNRGKRSIGLALENPAARDVLYDLARSSDVFLTNFLPDARKRLQIEVEDLRRINPQIIYVRGSAHGPKGPDADKGGYDGCTFWSRAGSAMGATPPDSPRVIGMPAGAYGDSMGGMTIAGGISAALFAREKTGEPSIIDVSLLHLGAWAMALSVNNALLTGQVMPVPPLNATGGLAVNPLVGNYKTADGRWINLTMLQPGRYWADVCRHLEREDLITDERFDTAEKIMANAGEASAIINKIMASRPFDDWIERFQTLEGQWAPNLDPLEVGNDPQVRANGYVASVVDQEGNQRELVTSPVQFEETPPTLTRAPQFAEHTDDILREIGRSEDEILQLKIDGAVT